MANIKGPWGNPQPSQPKRPNPGAGSSGPTGNNGNSNTSNAEWEEFLRRSQKRFKGLMNDKGQPAPIRLWSLVFLVLLAIWLASGFYIIQPGERGVILQLGKYNRTTTPGANYHLPYPFEQLFRVNVERVNIEEVGYRTNPSRFKKETTQSKVNEESLMLTGDENIVDINLEVQWNIKNARNYLFQVRDSGSENTIKGATESALRDVFGKVSYTDALLGEKRAENALALRKSLQTILDSYHNGVNVLTIQIKKVDPPLEVIDAFRDVQTARADKEKEINQAEAYRNDIVPRARGAAAKIVQDAQAFEQAILARSEGESERFESVVTEYKKAPDVTRDRLYIETMESILGGMNKLMVDKQAAGSGVLPYLALPDLSKKNGTTK